MSEPVSLELVEFIERHSARAWPAPIVIPIHGWEMRFAPNSSSLRVNSLNPIVPDAGCFSAVLKAYITECASRDSKAFIRITPLARENEAIYLSSLKLVSDGPTVVKTVELHASSSRDPDVIVSSDVNDVWLDAYISAHHYSDAERAAVSAILANVPHEMGFAHILENGRPVAAGRTALIDGIAGIYQIATAPDARRKGYGRRIVSALMAYVAERRAGIGYLQVEARNAPARALYASLGFKSLYYYDYWHVPTSIVL
jgi:predicted GNAT family acetyltransferase